MTTPSWRISNEPEERRKKREEKKMPFIVTTYVYASSQGQRTHSARTNLEVTAFPCCRAPPAQRRSDQQFPKMRVTQPQVDY